MQFPNWISFEEKKHLVEQLVEEYSPWNTLEYRDDVDERGINVVFDILTTKDAWERQNKWAMIDKELFTHNVKIKQLIQTLLQLKNRIEEERDHKQTMGTRKIYTITTRVYKSTKFFKMNKDNEFKYE